MTVDTTPADKPQQTPFEQFRAFACSQPVIVRELLAGGIAGGLAKTSVAPLERAKILFQTGRVSGVGVLATLSDIYATEGVRGLFKGNNASVLRIVPYAAIHFSAYELYRRELLNLVERYHAGTSTSPGATTSGADDAAAAASAAAQDDDDDDERLPGGVTGTTIEISSGGGAPHAPHAAHGAGTGSQTHAATPGRLGAVAAILARTKRPTTAPPQEPSSHAAPPSSTAADGTSCPRNDARPPLGASSSVASGGEGGRGQQAQHGHAHTNPVWDLLAGSAAGATAVVLTYPLDVIRTRLAWTTAGAAGPSSVAVATGAHATSSATTAAGASAAAAAHASGASTAARELGLTAMAAHMYRTEGVQGLYRGMAPTLLGILPYAGVKFYVYQSLKNLYNSRVADAGGGGGGRDGGGRDDGSCSGSNSAAASAAGGEAAAEGSGAGRKGRRGRMPVHVMLACGAVSGLISQTLTYPLDVVRRRMQVRQQPHKPGAGGGAAMHSTRTEQPAGAAAAAAARSSSSGDPTTTLQTFRAVLREEGPRGLFRGLSINFMKVVPSTAVGFALYDACKSYLDLQGNL